MKEFVQHRGSDQLNEAFYQIAKSQEFTSRPKFIFIANPTTGNKFNFCQHNNLFKAIHDVFVNKNFQRLYY